MRGAAGVDGESGGRRARCRRPSPGRPPRVTAARAGAPQPRDISSWHSGPHRALTFSTRVAQSTARPPRALAQGAAVRPAARSPVGAGGFAPTASPPGTPQRPLPPPGGRSPGERVGAGWPRRAGAQLSPSELRARASARTARKEHVARGAECARGCRDPRSALPRRSAGSGPERPRRDAPCGREGRHAAPACSFRAQSPAGGRRGGGLLGSAPGDRRGRRPRGSGTPGPGDSPQRNSRRGPRGVGVPARPAGRLRGPPGSAPAALGAGSPWARRCRRRPREPPAKVTRAESPAGRAGRAHRDA